MTSIDPSSLAHGTDLQKKIHELRGKKVLLDHDLARLYDVEAKALNQAVKRNIERFPSDFMFQLTVDEFAHLRSQIVTSSHGGIRRPPHAFTEQGVAMLSSVLRSNRAVQVNIEIMRAFVRLRSMTMEHKELSRRIDTLEGKYDTKFKAVFQAIRELMVPPNHTNKPIGFRRDTE